MHSNFHTCHNPPPRRKIPAITRSHPRAYQDVASPVTAGNKLRGGARFARPFYYRVLGFVSARTLRVRFVYTQANGFQLGKSGLMQCRALELFTRKKTSSEPINSSSSSWSRATESVSVMYKNTVSRCFLTFLNKIHNGFCPRQDPYYNTRGTVWGIYSARIHADTDAGEDGTVEARELSDGDLRIVAPDL